MERTPKVEQGREKGYDREAVGEEALAIALALLEEKVPEGISAEAVERLAALTEIMTQMETENDNDNRHTIEALAKLRRFAELEIEFKQQSDKLELMTR